MENKKLPLFTLLTSSIIFLASIITIGAGLYALKVQKYNPMISLAIVCIGTINVFLAIKSYKGKNWTYYAVYLYLISLIPIILINPLDLPLKIGLLIVDILLVTIMINSQKIKKFYKIDEFDSLKEITSDAWKFTKEDSLPSWLIVISLILIMMKFTLFPLLTLLTGTPLPIVIVESCSMYHETSFDSWWSKNSAWYEKNGISRGDFLDYNFKNGMNKGDIILVQAAKEYKKGDIIIFTAPTAHPIIHRIVSESPIETKGDHNLGQIEGIETDISTDRVIGKAVFKIPLLGWIKLIFFEPFQAENNKGFCK